MLKKAVLAGLFASTLAVAGFAQEGPVPKGIPHLDHVFVIMMENHGYAQIIGNPDAPFANAYAKSANSGTNYFAVAHPSLNNYLEIVGGSNFGVQSDNNPDWHNANCATNLSTGTVNTDTPTSGLVCPIYGTGTDAPIPAIDCTNEVQCNPAAPNGELNLDGTISYAANPKTVGKTIADELSAVGGTWKTYQESLPLSGADRVDFADGYFTDSSNIPAVLPGQPPTSQSLVELYAAKHDPFVYFRSVQEGELNHVVPFSGPNGLFADLTSGHVPNYSFIAPNQCHDQHGKGNAGPQCAGDPNDNGTQTGLNPALISVGDQALENIVNAIHGSSAWREGRSAIIVVWDENDYSVAPINNRVLAIVDTNYGPHGVTSNNFYTHFSLLKSVEAGLAAVPEPRLRCCDARDVGSVWPRRRLTTEHNNRGEKAFAAVREGLFLSSLYGLCAAAGRHGGQSESENGQCEGAGIKASATKIIARATVRSRAQPRKSLRLLAGLRIRRFDLIAEPAELPEHSCCAPLFRLFSDR